MSQALECTKCTGSASAHVRNFSELLPGILECLEHITVVRNNFGTISATGLAECVKVRENQSCCIFHESSTSFDRIDFRGLFAEIQAWKVACLRWSAPSAPGCLLNKSP